MERRAKLKKRKRETEELPRDASPETDSDIPEDTPEREIQDVSANNVRVMDFNSLLHPQSTLHAFIEMRPLGCIAFLSSSIDLLVTNLPPRAIAEINALQARLLKTYRHVNMDHPKSAFILIGAVLLSLAELTSDPNTHAETSLFPSLTWPLPSSGLPFIHLPTRTETRITDISFVDCAVAHYTNELDAREAFLGMDNIRPDPLLRTPFHFVLKTLPPHVPLAVYFHEALAQVLVAAEARRLSTLRFVLTNGASWLFCLLSFDKDVNRWGYAHSVARSVNRDVLRAPDGERELKELIVVLKEWLIPSVGREVYKVIADR